MSAEQPPGAEPPRDADDNRPRRAPPEALKIFVVVAITALAILAVVHLAGGGFWHHGLSGPHEMPTMRRESSGPRQ